MAKGLWLPRLEGTARSRSWLSPRGCPPPQSTGPCDEPRADVQMGTGVVPIRPDTSCGDAIEHT